MPELVEEGTRRKRGAKRRLAPCHPVTVLLTEQQLVELDSIATSAGRSRSDLLREAADRVWTKPAGNT